MKRDDKSKKWNFLWLRGLRQQWIVNSVMPVLLLLVVLVLLFSVGISNFYYNSIRDGLEQQAKAQAGAFMDYFMSEGFAGYLQKANQAVADFEEKNRIEMQFVSNSGRI